jgi:hypothetical protein
MRPKSKRLQDVKQNAIVTLDLKDLEELVGGLELTITPLNESLLSIPGGGLSTCMCAGGTTPAVSCRRRHRRHHRHRPASLRKDFNGRVSGFGDVDRQGPSPGSNGTKPTE